MLIHRDLKPEVGLATAQHFPGPFRSEAIPNHQGDCCTYLGACARGAVGLKLYKCLGGGSGDMLGPICLEAPLNGALPIP